MINRIYIEQYDKNIREHDREEFRKLLLEDEVIRNNTKLQKKYMELYDKYTRRELTFRRRY